MSNSYLQPASKSPSRLHRPQPQRTSMSSDSSTSSSASFSHYNDSPAPRVETLRCSRCAKCVETVVGTARAGNGDLALGRVSTDDASVPGWWGINEGAGRRLQIHNNRYYHDGSEWRGMGRWNYKTHDDHEKMTTSAFRDSYTNISDDGKSSPPPPSELSVLDPNHD
ncbi:hypothetical protein LHYA1_G006002 [Lachnellula hyalina]|uniref:Uncharacterized protein n=1 Tax=Lachnellula hyalina TaxID=1316788 RepID=A0A8H8R0T6_9HELO|nr:uncharacterized protein LHYA1_G006002 [Lachnellula hyalina]TVY26373.1 hypothetical protein LHYA1_G006002 [Lachnellula hyalina]